KRIAKNTIFLYIRMFFVLIVSLYTSRVVLNTLGISDYGVYNVVGGFVSLFGFLNATLSASMQRFFNFEGGQRGEDGVRDVYTAGFWIHVLLAVVILILLESFGLWYINNVMVVPADRLHAANILFQYSIFSMALVILEIPYTSAIMSYERMDFYALVSIIDVVLKLLIVLALPFIPYDKLISYATLTLIITVANFLLYFIYAKKNFLALKLGHGVNKSLFRSFLSFSGWNLVGTFAYMLKGQGINMILNVFFGTIINAATGVAYQISSAVNGFSSNISTAFRPQIVDSYSKNNNERVLKMFFSESKVCYCLILVLMVPVIIEIDYILHLWLGDAVPEYANNFASLVLIDMLVCTLNTPVTQVTFSTGNIKTYQIVSSCINLLLIPVCYIFLKMGFDAISVFVITIIFSIINQVGCLLCMKKVFAYSMRAYFKSVVIPLAAITILLPIIPYLISVIMETSFLRLFLICIVDVVLAFCLIWWIVLNSKEQILVKEFIYKKIMKRDA
ncbi:MAG: hypothetical protein KBT27_07045, partial [Prevotellaceae bacterium]|nr:hypothetical protein [Candidatus Faecinaster equi]